MRKYNTKGGILVAVRDSIHEPILIDSDADNASFLNIEIKVNDIPIRIIACYAPQDSADIEIKTKFVSDINYQILTAIGDECEIILAGDFNCRFSKDLIPWEINDNSNGVNFNTMLEDYELNLLNCHHKANGSFTRKRNGVNSTLDYIASTSLFYHSMTDFTVYDNVYRLHHDNIISDHLSLFTSFNIKINNSKNNKRDTKWHFCDDGYNKFKLLTEDNDNLVNIVNNYSGVNSKFNNWYKYINNIMYKCFSRKRINKKTKDQEEIAILLQDEIQKMGSSGNLNYNSFYKLRKRYIRNDSNCRAAIKDENSKLLTSESEILKEVTRVFSDRWNKYQITPGYEEIIKLSEEIISRKNEFK